MESLNNFLSKATKDEKNLIMSEFHQNVLNGTVETWDPSIILTSILEKRIKERKALERLCSGCGHVKLKKECMKCAKCKRAYYCNTECQRIHWPQHKSVCKTNPGLSSSSSSCDCCDRPTKCGDIYCDCCMMSWRNDVAGDLTCHCNCRCNSLLRDCRYTCGIVATNLNKSE